MNKRIIQSSPGRTGSTLLCNVLYGLFCRDKPIVFQKQTIDLKNHLVVKTHRLDFAQNTSECSGYDALFVCSSRRGVYQVRSERSDCTIIDYDKLCSFGSKTDLARFVAEAVGHHMKASEEDVRNAADRVKAMNDRVSELKDKPFSSF